MIVKSLLLSNFRKFSKKQISFSPSVTVITGENATGKTNILESLFLLATGKSFRTSTDMEMILFEKDLGRITAAVEGKEGQTTNLEIVLTRGMVMDIKTPFKRYLVNGIGKRIIDFMGNLRVVLFWPQDMELVTDSPSFRRRYLDFVLSQIDREYRRTLVSYERGVRQRNKVLEAIREKGAHRHQLLFWDQLLIRAGEYITKKREEYIRFVNSYTLSTQDAHFTEHKIEYDASIISRARLDQYTQEEIAAAVTLVGPHRDDFKFEIRSRSNRDEITRNLSHFGSRGEQRLAVLWLKLAELSYVERQTTEKPVLLLDDIFSELDDHHRKIIFDVIGKQQSILTTTDKDQIDMQKLKHVEIINLQ